MTDTNQYVHMSRWLRQTLNPPSSELINRERKEFNKFVQAMRSYDSGKAFSLPHFKYRDLSSWRIFFQIFPQSARLLEPMFNAPNHWPRDQIKAGFLLASTLANSDDLITSNTGNDLLRRIEPHLNLSKSTKVGNYSEFAVIREYLFTYVEGQGTKHEVERFKDFIHRHPAIWEKSLNRGYYSALTDATTEEVLLAKIRNPKSRDVKAIPILEILLELIKRSRKS